MESGISRIHNGPTGGKYKSILCQGNSFEEIRDTLFKRYNKPHTFIIISPDKTYKLFHKKYPKNVSTKYNNFHGSISKADEYLFYHEKYYPELIEKIINRQKIMGEKKSEYKDIVVLFDDSITKIDTTLLNLIHAHRHYFINLIISCNTNSLEQIIKNDKENLIKVNDGVGNNNEKQKSFEGKFCELIYTKDL